MGMQLQFSMADAVESGLAIDVKADYHPTGGGKYQDGPWLDLFGVVSTAAGYEFSVNITGTDNPMCWMDRSYVQENKIILEILALNNIPFSFS